MAMTRNRNLPYGDSSGGPFAVPPARPRRRFSPGRVVRAAASMVVYLLGMAALTAGLVALLWKVSGR